MIHVVHAIRPGVQGAPQILPSEDVGWIIPFDELEAWLSDVAIHPSQEPLAPVRLHTVATDGLAIVDNGRLMDGDASEALDDAGDNHSHGHSHDQIDRDRHRQTDTDHAVAPVS